MSFPRYSRYKDSGVEWLGEVPEHWTVQRLKHLVTLTMGQSPSSDDCTQEGNGLPFLQGNADFGDRFPLPRSYCEVATKIARDGDILFSVRAPVGAINIADQSCGIGRGLCALTTKPDNSIHFLFHALQVMKVAIQSVANGSTYESVTVDQVANAICLAPPAVEQTRIASFLDRETSKIDASVSEQLLLIELLKEKRQAVISHAVTKGLNPHAPMKPSGIEWLGDVPEHWEVKTVRYACQIDNTFRFPIDKQTRTDLVGEYPYYGPTGVLSWINEYRVEGEYFLLGEDGDHFLKFAKQPMTILVDGKFNANNHAHLIRGIGECSTAWACRYFEHKDLLPWLIKQGVGRYKLRKETLQTISIVIPPKNEQMEILRWLDVISATTVTLTTEVERAIELLHERRAALISAAVTGKIDVRGLVQAEAA